MPVTEQAFEGLKSRVSAVETQMAVMESQYDGIDKRLSRIEVVLSRLTWIMVSGIGSAFILFVINGGIGHVAAAGGLK